MDGNEALTAKQSRVIPYLIASPSIEDGCKRARIGKATFYGWLKQDSFRDELCRKRKEVVELAFATLKANVTKAAQTLVKHLDSDKESISIRAAESIIEFAQRALEIEEAEPARHEEDLESYLTKEQVKQLEYARKRRLAAELARSQVSEKK